MQTIVIVGGGAGGLELATKLGNKLGKTDRIILVDKNYSHLWKPLLHEVATGVLDTHDNEVNYQVHAKKHHFDFRLGSLTELNRQKKYITLTPLLNDAGEIIRQALQIHYDQLVIAVGLSLIHI